MSDSDQTCQAYSLTEKAVQFRQKYPTGFQEGKLTCSLRSCRKRRRETFAAAQKIHGGNAGSSLPGAIGLLDTALNKCNQGLLVDVLSANKKFNKQVMPAVYKRNLSRYELSEENMLRSISVYYSGGIAGKKKYRKIYRDSCYKASANHKGRKRLSINECPIPRLVPYHKLQSFVRSIPVGNIYSVADTLCNDLDENEKVSGCFRSLKELLVCLAEFYLSGHSGFDVTWFEEEYKFLVTLGGDGAPFGKDETACAWLVSFLNIGRGVLSNNENYLLFGANCSENCIAVQKYIKLLLSEIQDIEKNIFSCKFRGSAGLVTVNVKFQIAELPNDMKMISFLSGELSNSAKYFSSFANVSTDDATVIDGTFGNKANSTWQPWKYSSRLTAVKKVDALKKKLAKQQLTNNTKRSKITTLIASMKSRQEFLPPLGKVIDRIHIEPLHLKNNACALAHKYLLREVIAISRLPHSVKTFSEISDNSALAIYIMTMKKKCQLSRLSKKIVKWFNETQGDGKTFDFRFTGRESRRFLHNFMYLIDAVEPMSQKGTKEHHTLHVLAYFCLTLRNCVSLFSRVEITDEQVVELESNCKTLFTLNCLFFSHHPTIWHLGNVVPVHTKEMHNRYGMGLALNSMEGREAKHISIARYAKNTNYSNRWQQVFRHEHISLLWLRAKGYNVTKPSSVSSSYIPRRATSNPAYCNCGMEKSSVQMSKCRFCVHELRKCISEKVKKAVIKG